MPKVLFTHFCERLERDPITHHYSLHRVFNKISAHKKPFSFFLVVYWAGEIGETFTQSFVITDNLGNVKEDGIQARLTIKDVDDNMGAAYFQNLIFDSPGRFQVHVDADGITCATVPLFIVTTPGKYGAQFN